jgi:UDP-3-O-[3-hydroxymyristoyl] N-acetylglucosamine deacetylase
MVNVSTVEHLMAALWGCGIDNLFVDIDGPEVPIMDGSAEPFIFLFECAGIEKQSAPKKTIKVIKKVEVLYNDTSISVEPSDNFAVNLSIDYGGRINSLCGNVNYDETCSFKADLCRARTFGFIEEVDKLRSMGLALGGSLDNAVVVNTDGDIMNEGGLRYNDEFARHKALDLIGDLYLCGSTIKACFSGIRSGHFLNNELLRRLFTDQTAWTCL